MAGAHSPFSARHVMIMAAPNGARRGKADHPALPVTPADLAECAAAVLDGGASVLHLHVRGADGGHTLDADAYRAAQRAIRRSVGGKLVVQITTEAVGRYAPEAQMSVVRELRPEAVSLALCELCPDDASEARAAAFFEWLAAERIWPQYILYSADELRRFDALARRGLFAEERPSCLLVLGRYAESRHGDPEELATRLAAVDPDRYPWTVCCFGPREHAAAIAALEHGGHARIGFENNLVLADGRPARDNAALIRQFVAALGPSTRRPATADDVRDAFLGGSA